MSNEVAEIKSNLPAQLVGLGNLAVATAQLNVNTGGQFYLKMDRSGVWVYGAEDTEVEPDSLWAVNPRQLSKGYVAWADDDAPNRPNKPLEQMYNLASGAAIPMLADLPELPYKGSWSDQLGCQLLCATGDDKDTQAIFKTNSGGGVEALGQLMQAIGAKIAAGDIDCVPLVKLTSSSYKHQTYGTIYKPKFEIDSWMAIDADMEEGPHREPEPEKVEEKAEATPTRRRRRRTA